MTARERVVKYLDEAGDIANSRLDEWTLDYLVGIAQMLQAEDLHRRAEGDELYAEAASRGSPLCGPGLDRFLGEMLAEMVKRDRR